MADDSSKKEKLDLQLQQQGADIHLEQVKALYKLELFLTALIFAVLSFAIQFPVASPCFWIKIIEGISWVLLALSGLLRLKHMGAFVPNDTVGSHGSTKLSGWKRKFMWGIFLSGLTLLLTAKIADSFLR